MIRREFNLFKFKEEIIKSSKLTEDECQLVLDYFSFFLRVDEVSSDENRWYSSITIKEMKKFGMSITTQCRQTSTLNALAVAFGYETWGKLKNEAEENAISFIVQLHEKDIKGVNNGN